MNKIKMNVAQLTLEEALEFYRRGYAIEVNNGQRGMMVKEVCYRCLAD